MPRSRPAAGLLFACSLLLAAFPAGAQSGQPPASASPAEQAAAVQDQLRQWAGGLLGPQAAEGLRQLRVTAETDTLRVTLPLGGMQTGLPGWTLDAAPLEATLRPLDGGRWQILSARAPLPLRVQGPAPQHASRGTSGGAAGGSSSGSSGATRAGPAMGTWTLRVDDQKTTGVLDPTLRTASSFETTLRNLENHTVTPGEEQTTRTAGLTARYGWEPTGPDRLHVFWKASREGHHVSLRLPQQPRQPQQPQQPALELSIARMEEALSAEDVSFARLGTLLRAVAAVMEAMPRDTQAGHGLPPGVQDQLRQAVADMPDLLGRFEASAQVHDLAIANVALRGSLAEMDVEAHGEPTGEGMVRLALHQTLRGLESPLIPPAMRDLVPHKLVMATWAAGLPGRELSALLARALEKDAPPPSPEAFAALLRRGPLTFGLDAFDFDVGPASVTAHGTLRMPSTTEFAGTLQIRATGLDALMTRAQNDQQLARLVPMLAMLKGFGRPQGAEMVWDIVADQGRTLVNGTDLGALIKAAHAPQGRRPQERKD